MTAQSSIVNQLKSKLSPTSMQFLAQSVLPPPAVIPTADDDVAKMALFEAALDEAEHLPTDALAAAESTPSLLTTIPPQALPQATEELWQQAQAIQASHAPAAVSKERAVGQAWSLDSAVQESGGLLSQVETERLAELSPEVERFLQKVENAQETPVEKIEALVPAVSPTPPAQQTQLVRVVPITPKIEAVGQKKSPTFSVRWLVEFSHKIIKMFNGKVVYQAAKASKS